MRLIISLFTLIPLITWKMTYRRNKDLLLPRNIFTILYTITITIPVILFATNNYIDAVGNSYLKKALNTDSAYFEYIFLSILCYYLVIIGMKIRVSLSRTITIMGQSDNNVSTPNADNSYYRFFGIILWCIGFLAFILIMIKTGGIYNFYSNLQLRTTLVRNIDVLTWILPLMSYGVLLIVYSMKNTNKNLNWKIISFAIATGFFQGLGGRKAIIILIIEVCFVYHYTVKRLNFHRLVNLKTVVLIFLMFNLSVLMSSLRTDGAFDDFISNPLGYLFSSGNGIGTFLCTESYVPFFVFIIYYFRTHALWYGTSFLGLLTALIPSSLYPGKPPVDDGTYLYSICMGRSDIEPVMSFDRLNGSSYPLETFGAMYANFGLIGLILGMIVLGMIIGWFYRNMKRRNYSLFSVVMYVTVLFGFELSTLRLIQVFETTVVVGVITLFVGRIRFGKGSIKVKKPKFIRQGNS